MATLPITKIADYPRELDGHRDENGGLPASVLTIQPGSSPKLTMCLTAMRSLVAMSAALKRATGLTLRAISATDSYRPYPVQRRMFLDRYTKVPNGTDPKLWDSNGDGVKEKWYKKDPDLATAAVPGSSNHGLGLACDFVRDGRGRILAWLIDHADEYGFSAELPSEEWHWHYYPGDAIPAATLAYEEDEMALSDTDAQALIWRVEALVANRATVAGGPTAGQANKLQGALAAIGSALVTVASKVDLSPAELAAVKAAASSGAEAGALASADELATAIAALLPDGVALTKADVEAAVRAVVVRSPA